jgi:poly(A) polymerase
LSGHPSLPSLKGAEWLAWKSVCEIFNEIGGQGHDIRAVGGAIRDTLFSRSVSDVDFATTARPEEVMECATKAGLKVIPTGLKHGTVTIIADGKPFEVTTLRKDVETYGRHAKVDFTDDWAEDAGRRDFTINALYADADGALFDPLGGYGDIAERNIRFIGDAGERVREDYLRILRFFRFHAYFGDGEFDTTALQACVRGRGGLQSLSAERVNSELMRLLCAPRAAEALQGMFDYGLLVDVLGAVPHLNQFERLIAIEMHLGDEPDAALRLAALVIWTFEDAMRLTQRLRLSNTQRQRLEHASGFRGFTAEMDDAAVRSKLYGIGRSGCRDAALMAWAASGDEASDGGWRALLTRFEKMTVPDFPIHGADIMKLGVPEGSAIGEAMRDAETRWIAGDFTLTRAELLEMAHAKAVNIGDKTPGQ